MIYVVAGNRAQFLRYCLARGLEAGEDARFLSRPEQVARLSSARFVLTGTYRKLAVWPELQAAIWLCPNSSMEVDRDEAD